MQIHPGLRQPDGVRASGKHKLGKSEVVAACKGDDARAAVDRCGRLPIKHGHAALFPPALGLELNGLLADLSREKGREEHAII